MLLSLAFQGRLSKNEDRALAVRDYNSLQFQYPWLLASAYATNRHLCKSGQVDSSGRARNVRLKTCKSRW